MLPVPRCSWVPAQQPVPISAQSFLIRLGELQLINEKAATGLKGRIEAHYQRTGYGEPDATRRILSPNGRLGDLLSITSRNKETAEEALAIGRTLRGLKLEGVPEAIAADKNGNESRIVGAKDGKGQAVLCSLIHIVLLAGDRVGERPLFRGRQAGIH